MMDEHWEHTIQVAGLGREQQEMDRDGEGSLNLVLVRRGSRLHESTAV